MFNFLKPTKKKVIITTIVVVASYLYLWYVDSQMWVDISALGPPRFDENGLLLAPSIETNHLYNDLFLNLIILIPGVVIYLLVSLFQSKDNSK